MPTSELMALKCETCEIDDHCVGERWVPSNDDELAALLATIAMGQVAQASYILQELVPAAPAYSSEQLRQEAKIRLTVEEPASNPRRGYPKIQRDGFVFEVISWIAAKLYYGSNALLKDPHVSATSQGLDGLMLKLKNGAQEIESSTVFEDKCTNHPRNVFLSGVIPAFQDRHRNLRSAEIVSSAEALLRSAGLHLQDVARLSAAVTDKSKRKYRAAFALPTGYDTLEERKKLFANFDRIEGVNAEQRIGASFITPADMRPWIGGLADRAIEYLETLEEGES